MTVIAGSNGHGPSSSPARSGGLMKSSDHHSLADNACDNHAMGQPRTGIDRSHLDLASTCPPSEYLRERNCRQHGFAENDRLEVTRKFSKSSEMFFFFFFFFPFFTFFDAKRDEVDTTKSERGDIFVMWGRGGGGRTVEIRGSKRRSGAIATGVANTGC